MGRKAVYIYRDSHGGKRQCVKMMVRSNIRITEENPWAFKSRLQPPGPGDSGLTAKGTSNDHVAGAAHDELGSVSLTKSESEAGAGQHIIKWK